MNTIENASAHDLLKLVRSLSSQILPLLDIIDKRPDGTTESSGATEALQELSESLLTTAFFIEKRYEEQTALSKQIQIRVDELVEELEPLREAENERQKEARLEERLEAIVGLLFPPYNAVHCRENPKDRPPIHPEKAWWWNGAGIKSRRQSRDGSWTLGLSSYVGCGETDEFEVTVPSEWIVAEDPAPLILAWIQR